MSSIYRADFTPEEKLLWDTAFQAGLKRGAEIAARVTKGFDSPDVAYGAQFVERIITEEIDHSKDAPSASVAQDDSISRE